MFSYKKLERKRISKSAMRGSGCRLHCGCQKSLRFFANRNALTRAASIRRRFYIRLSPFLRSKT